MKVTVTITMDELKQLVTPYLSSTIQLDKVIVEESGELAFRIIDEMTKEFQVMPVVPEKRIAAIKHLRNIVMSGNMSLFDAKYAIENWDHWINFVKERNRLPQLTKINTGYILS
jgi:ribosomal protein L7/L12